MKTVLKVLTICLSLFITTSTNQINRPHDHVGKRYQVIHQTLAKSVERRKSFSAVFHASLSEIYSPGQNITICKNLGVIFDSEPSFIPHIKNITKIFTILRI